MLGPFWLTLSMGILVGTLGLVFSTLFQQDVGKTLPYISTGIIFWGLLTGCINEGTTVFISAESFIRNVPMPLSVHFYRMMARNVIIWGFNMAIYLVVVVYFGLMPGWNALLFIPGFILFLINAAWISLAVGVLSTRYRDIPQVIANADPGRIFPDPDLLVAGNLAEPAGLCGAQPVLSPHRDRSGAVAERGGVAIELGPLHRHGGGRARLHRLALSPGPRPHRILGLSRMAHISIENLTVEFAIFGASARSLKNQILSQATGGRVMAGARDVITVRAIDGLNLEINDGDRIGLVGHNGSGKTTLLRVLAGIYKPSGGAITIEGQVGALLDPTCRDGPGIDRHREHLSARLHDGHEPARDRGKLDEIAEFTELGDFLELPMRTYSAGMFARLAFAVSTAAHNDILLIDEGIGAGDAAFQKKAQQRIESLFDRTPIVILASHSEGLISEFCTRRVQMEHGVLKSAA